MADKKEEVAAPAVPDFAAFDAMLMLQEEGIDVHIKGPTGKDLGLVIRVAGPDSDVQKRAVQAIRDERLKSDDPNPLTSEQIADNQLRGLAMSVLSSGPFQIDGVVHNYSVDNITKLFRRYAFVREQVERVASSRASFMRSSSTDASKPSAGGSED